MNKRQFIRIAGGGVIAAATLASLPGCSAALPPEAVAAWQPPSPDLDIRRWAVSHALLAPHAHNLQSWLVDLDTPDTIVLRMDLRRLLPDTDPWSRQLVISQGTFVELLDIAAKEKGYRSAIEMFPEGEFDAKAPDGRPTARIRLLADAAAQPDPLFAQIFHRHTHRGMYENRIPNASARQALADSVKEFPVQLGVVTADEASMEQHRQIAMDAWRTEMQTPRTLLESYKVLRVGPQEITQHRDGISVNTPMLRGLVALGLFDRSKPSDPDSSAVKGQISDFNDKMATTPACVWLSTADNTRTTQMLAGRAYVRLQLAATALGLRMHPLSQALQEYPEQAHNYKAIH
ncbi:MAG: twin-arginine translocation pathway signal protein, partial [Betaproteobacteria bacterium]|nr:twin-arginine translocation pathway signal protein [Betaproteobacteria bacterium]